MEPYVTLRAPEHERTSGRNTKRRWCIPPAMLREASDTLEASGMLYEHGGALGLALWQSLRDVTLWASLDAGARADAFAAGAGAARRRLLRGLDPAVELPLGTLAALLDAPGAARPAVVSLVCREIARWAEERDAPETALAYAQAAALALPQDPSAALAVGIVALHQAKPARAETWLRRTVGLSRRAGAWRVYAEAFVELGALYARRGNRAGARRFLLRALRAGRRRALPEMRGRALHALFLLALDAGWPDEAERFARGAVRAYGREHPRLPQLLHDVASLWVGQGSHGRALPMLQKLLPLRTDLAERTATLALLARAAAGAGEVRTAGDAWTCAWENVPDMGDHQAVAAALADLARAAAATGDWERLEQAVRRAIRAGVRSGEAHLPADVEQLARTVREQLR